MDYPPLLRTTGGVLLGSLLVATGCKQVCGENLPEYTLSAAQRAWGNPYAANTTWRFRNAAGKERTYRVSSFKMDQLGGGGASKVSVCPTYYLEYIFADLERTDTTQVYATRELYHLQLSAALPDGSTSHFLQWNYHSFTLPIDEVDAGRLVPPAATFGGHTYPGVITCTNSIYLPLVLHLYLTKADGVVAFDDRYGTLWVRQ